MPLHEIDEVRQYVASGSEMQGGGNVGVESSCQIRCVAGPGTQRVKDLGLAFGTMRDEPVDAGDRIIDRVAVAGMKTPRGSGPQPGAGAAERREVAVGGRNQRAGPSHDEIAGKHRVAPGKAQMPRHVPGQMQRRQRRILQRDLVPVLQRLVRGEIKVETLTTAETRAGKPLHHGAAARRGSAKAEDRGPGGLRKRARESGMITMRMGDENRLDRPAVDPDQKRRQMRRIVRAGVDDAKPVPAEKIAVGSRPGERRGVGGQQPHQTRLDLLGRGVGHAFPFRPGRLACAMVFDWLKRWMPRGLQGRAALILLLPVVTLQLVISISFVQRHFEGVTRQMTRSVLIDLRYLSESVDAAPDRAAAATVARQLGRPLELETRFAAPPPEGDAVRVIDLSGQAVIATLRAGLDGTLAVRIGSSRRVTVWIDTAHGPLEVRFDRRRVSASNPHQLIVLIVVLGALLTLVAYLFLRTQLRPVTRLAAVAAAYGKGRVVPYKAGGAAEVRAAGMAFLDMRNRIERQTQARRLMLSGISHDLRTPLTRLRLGLTMLPDEEAALLVGDVDEMRRLLDAFLDFARGDASEAAETVDPAQLVTRIVEDAQRTGQAVILRPVQGESRPMPLRTTALRRALENLIGNALRYGSRCEVSLLVTPRGLRLLVEDDGPGIPEDRREEAMRPFTRLDPARNQDLGTGVGLGLAIVADIAHGHGGALHLGDSERLGGLRAELVLAR